MAVRNKSLVVRQLADLVSRIRRANSSCPKETQAEIDELDLEIGRIERELGDVIDQLMANQLAVFNTKAPVLDIHGLSRHCDTSRHRLPRPKRASSSLKVGA